MYQVIKMFGDFEPWWFIDNWQEDIVSEERFSKFEVALSAFMKEWRSLKNTYPLYHSREDLLAAFWDGSEKHFCEECDEDIQSYHSLLLLKDYQIVSAENFQTQLKQFNKCSSTLSECVVRLQYSSVPYECLSVER